MQGQRKRGSTVEVRLIKDWRRWREGRVLDVPSGAGEVLVKRGVAVLIGELPPQAVTTEKRPKKK